MKMQPSFLLLAFSISIAILFTTPADGFRFPLSRVDLDVIKSHTALVPCTPRPMFSKPDAPFSLFGETVPSIELSGSAAKGTKLTELMLVHFVSDYEYRSLGLNRIIWDDNFVFCKAPVDGKPAIRVPEVARLGEKITFYEEVKVPILTPAVGEDLAFNKRIDVNVTGYHYVLIANCRLDEITITKGYLDFKNPHGYLPGGWYLKLPLTGLVMISYAVLTVRYVIRCMRYRDHILYLQYGIVCVMGMGLIEQASYFFTFLGMNDSGSLPCCPVRKDIVFCLMVSVFKRGTLVIFLLAVSLGYGTVKPKLGKRDATAVITVGMIYIIGSVNFEYRVIAGASEQQDDGTSGSKVFLLSALFVSLCNVCVISWIYFSIVELIKKLKDEGQSAKLKMYQNLARALVLWVAIGFFFEVMFYMVVSSAISLDWKYETLPKFSWDFLFLLVVVQIAYIWFPSETTSKYAYSSQLPTTDLDEFDAGIELPEAGHVPGQHNEFVIGDDDDYDDDDDDDDFDKDFIAEDEQEEVIKKKPIKKVALD